MKKIIFTACIAVLATFSPVGSGAFAAQDISTYSQRYNSQRSCAHIISADN